MVPGHPELPGTPIPPGTATPATHARIEQVFEYGEQVARPIDGHRRLRFPGLPVNGRRGTPGLDGGAAAFWYAVTAFCTHPSRRWAPPITCVPTGTQTLIQGVSSVIERH